jgi:S1-C subfamily serine protease
VLFADADGLLVHLVLPDRQGAAAGLSLGDVLIGYGHVPLDATQQLIDLIGSRP